MKNIIKITALSLLAMVLCVQFAFAEPSDIVKNIFDSLLAEGSAYSKSKALYAEYYPETKMEEVLEDNGFTLSISGNQYIADGSWTFVQDGDYLSVTMAKGDFTGYMVATEVLDAVGSYYGIRSHLLNGYMNGLNSNGLENKYLIMDEDESSDTDTVRIYIAGPYELDGIDQMVLNENTLDFDPLGEDFLSMASSSGKMMMVANGNVDECSILIGEYGELDDLAYQSAINAAKVLQPKGWEEFVAEYKELAETDAPGYTVRLNLDESAVREIIDEIYENESYMLIRFGK